MSSRTPDSKATPLPGRNSLDTLEDTPMYHAAHSIAMRVTQIYEGLTEDEQFTYKYKFRNRAYDMLSDTAEACGSFLPKDIEYSLAQARRALTGLKASYRFLGTQRSLDIDPHFMVEIEKLTVMMDKCIQNAWINIGKIEDEKEPGSWSPRSNATNDKKDNK